MRFALLALLLAGCANAPEPEREPCEVWVSVGRDYVCMSREALQRMLRRMGY